MKAAVYKKYGPPGVVEIKKVPKPSPKPHEILVKVHATSVTAGDARIRASNFPPLFWLPARLIFGLFRPKKTVLGHEWSGVVEAVGDKVKRFAIGDALFGTTTLLPNGAHSEYLCLPETWKSGVVLHKPKGVSFAHAAVLPVGAMTALFLWQKAKLQNRQQVLVNGASGSVGSYAVQMASHFGATVTAVCSAANAEMVRSLGASRVIDYNKEDFTKDAERYDIVFDAMGNTTKSRCKSILNKDGAFVGTQMWTKESEELLAEVKMLAEQGAIVPYIDKAYPLGEIVEAHRYVDSGRKRGNVLVTLV